MTLIHLTACNPSHYYDDFDDDEDDGDNDDGYACYAYDDDIESNTTFMFGLMCW